MFGRKQKEEFVTFRAVTGEPVRIPLHRSPVSRTVQFRVVSRQIGTIGQLVEVAVGACPELCAHGLLDPADSGRLAGMLHDFRSFRRGAAVSVGTPPAGELGLDRLGRALRSWVLGKFDNGGRLLALYALEAAYFLEAIAFGRQQEYPREHTWHLDGLAVAAGRDDGVDDDREFKRRFTQNLGGISLLARASEDLEVRLLARKPIVIPAGDEFRFTVWKCPVSGGGPGTIEFLVRRWELLRGCWPFGAIPIDENGGPLGRADSPATFTVPAHGTLPWRWVTHYLDCRGEIAVWAPVPSFEWKIDS